MRVYINSSIENVNLAVANKLVTDFAEEHPGYISNSSINSIVIGLSDRIVIINENPVQTDAHYRELEISLQRLPQALKEWAATKHIFQVDVAKIEENNFALISTAPYTYANNDWSDVEVVMQAGEGVRGAWFFSNAERGSVVVKGQEGADKQIMGTVFLRMMGVNAPDAKLVDCQSQEGLQLSAIGGTAGLNGRKPTHYIVMDRVKGPNYTNLSSRDIEIVQNNLERLGELAVYDLVLENFDRFQLDSTSFNSGNIMFQEGIMQAIDTDCLFDEERDGFTRLALRKIVENKTDLHLKIAGKLATHLGDGVDINTFSSDRIAQGMKMAIENLLNLSRDLERNKNSYLSNCADRGLINISFPKSIENNLQHILICKKELEG